MPISPEIQRAHDIAERKGKAGYVDPSTGLLVLTANYLSNRGQCCGAGCRHCPFPLEEQDRAGRPRDPESIE